MWYAGFGDPPCVVIFFLFCWNIYFCRFYVTIIKVTIVNWLWYAGFEQNKWSFKLSFTLKITKKCGMQALGPLHEVIYFFILQKYIFLQILCHCHHRKGETVNVVCQGIPLVVIFFKIIQFCRNIYFCRSTELFKVQIDIMSLSPSKRWQLWTECGTQGLHKISQSKIWGSEYL